MVLVDYIGIFLRFPILLTDDCMSKVRLYMQISTLKF